MRAALVDSTASAGSGALTAERRTRATVAEVDRTARVRAQEAHDARAAAALDSAREFSAEGRRELEQRVVLEYLGLANAIAQRFQSSGVELNELRQVAYVGLTKAVRRFDAQCGSGVAAFAVPTISGEIKRYLRDATWAVRPPRALQELALELRGLVPALAQRLGREPTVEELAAEVGRSPSRVSEALECGRGRQALSLDAPVGSTGGGGDAETVSLGDAMPAPEGEMEERADLTLTLTSALRTIPLAERRAVHLRYFRDMTQTEIAAEIGVSQMQVSRLLRRGLDALRRELFARGAHE
ncbi:RNA polymerase sigma factor SigF [Leucobacter sp. UCD-THU]|uniref:sigma-70 family RNA polymerase sigma factor n=1 Tax=Leucobacter sp. UCD-THU TaxID=1292023 RepID=UPI00035FACB3|nr:sigma-70 family RNA polymerase sigma factor [Leucobacter sp. UCD-THU]EYT56334.1 RNA polymerase sigma factor SigF [Leucobacter sp. UCD-THU]